MISGSLAFSKVRLNIWKFSVHVLLKPGLEYFVLEITKKGENYILFLFENLELFKYLFGLFKDIDLG